MNHKLLAVPAFVFTFLFGWLLALQLNEVIRNYAEPVEIIRRYEVTRPIQETASEHPEVIEEAGDDHGASDNFRTLLLEPGEAYHGDEVSARSGEKWLGLFQNDNDYFVRSTVVRVSKARDPIVDRTTNVKTGKTVSVEGSLQPLFLVKGSPAIMPKNVETYYRGRTWEEMLADQSGAAPIKVVTSLDKDFSYDFVANDERFLLKVIKARNKDGNRLLALVLESNGTRQILHTMRTSYEGERGESDWLGQTGTLYWIGDLDSDGRPDLYLDLFVHDNVRNRVLFLSSSAEKGKLVKKAAQFLTTGC